MNQSPRLVTAPARLLAGVRAEMSLVTDRTPELFRTFMPRRNELTERVSGDLILATVYGAGHFERFDPARTFTRWAAMEITRGASLPEGFERLDVPAGDYAVFLHRGPHHDDRLFRYIFAEWFPASGFVPDERPHLDLMGARYKHGADDSEEEIWVPVRRST